VRRILRLLILVLAPLLASVAHAEPLRDELVALLDRHVAAARLGSRAGIEALAAAETRERWARDPAAARRELLAAAQDSVAVEALVVTEPDRAASLYGVARRLGRPVELGAHFVREADGWRVAEIETFANPDTVQRPPDLDAEPVDVWNPQAMIPVIGRIVEVRQAGDEAMAVVRVTVDQEGAPSQAYDVALYLPTPQDMAAIGVPIESLTPWTWVSAEGARHRTKPLKVLVTRLRR
jgi:hypothetical protein